MKPYQTFELCRIPQHPHNAGWRLLNLGPHLNIQKTWLGLSSVKAGAGK